MHQALLHCGLAGIHLADTTSSPYGARRRLLSPAPEHLGARLTLGCLFLVLLVSSLFWSFVALRATSPLILADEYTYVARGLALDHLDHLNAIEPSVPSVGNYLFLRAINLLSRAHLPIHGAAKALNVACFGLATLLLGKLLLAKAPNWRSVAMLALVAFLPIGSYVAYVMPECAYLALFVALFCLLAARSSSASYRVWAAAGALIGALTLTKAHGLFVLVAFIGATLMWCAVTGRLRPLSALKLSLAAVAAFAATALIGKLVLGPPGAGAGGDIVGSFYWEMVRQSAPTSRKLLTAGGMMAMQVSAVLLMLAPSMAFLVAGVVSERRQPEHDPPTTETFSLPALFLLLLLGLIIAVVSVLISAEPTRILLRYVDFIFPCVLVLAWLWFQDKPELDTPRFRLSAAIAWAAGAGFFLFRLPSLRPLAADAPELFFSYSNGEFGAFGLGAATWWITGGLVAVCALSLLHPKVRWMDAQLVALLVLFPIADFNTLKWQGLWSASQSRLLAIGTAANTACGSGDGDLVAMGSQDNPGDLYTALSGVLRPIPLYVGADAALSTLAKIPNACVITSLGLKEALGAPLIAASGFGLYRPAAQWKVEEDTRFDRGVRPAMLGEGWSAPEAGGIWTDGRRAVLHLAPSQNASVVEVNAFAFDPPQRLGQRVEISLRGRALASWLVHDGVYSVRLPPAAGRVDLELTLPDAAAPSSVLPGNADTRQLGIAVRRVTVLTGG